MSECDLCGAETDTETLELSESAEPYNPDPDPWRIGRVCDDCRENELLPALRHLFRGTPWLDEPHDDGIRSVTPNPPHRFFVFTKPDRDTVHVARSVLRGPALGQTPLCVGACGIDARTEPEPRVMRLSAREEGITVCGRCCKHAPERIKGRQVA